MSTQNALTPIAGSNGYQQQIEIDTSEPLNLTVHNASGEIRVIGSDQPNVWVIVRRTSDDVDEDEPIGLTVNVDGNTIGIHPEWSVASGLGGLARRIRDQLKEGLNPDDWNLSRLRLNPDLEYDIRVEVPRALADGSKVVSRSASGAVTIKGLHSDVTVASGSGSSTIEDVEGKVSSHSASGSVTASKIRGSLEINTASGSARVTDIDTWTAIRTVSGSIAASRAHLANARVVTVSGSVKGDFILDNASDYLFESVSGSFNLDLTVPAAGSRSTLGFRSISGSARSQGGWVEESRKNWSVGSGETGPAIRVKTVSGSLSSSVREDAAVTARSIALPTDGPGSDEDEESGTGPSVSMDIDFDFDEKIDRVVSWAKETARSFSPPEAPSRPATPKPPAPTPPTAPAPPGGATDVAATQPLADVQPPAQTSSQPTGPGTAGDDSQLTTELANDRESQVNRRIATDDSLSVLEALERGDIDIDEALARIESDRPTGA